MGQVRKPDTTDRAAQTPAPAKGLAKPDPELAPGLVQEAAEESFPASDPPAFVSGDDRPQGRRTGPGRRDIEQVDGQARDALLYYYDDRRGGY